MQGAIEYNLSILAAMSEEQKYLDMLHKIVYDGHFRPTRNANTYSIFGHQLNFDLAAGFPLLTTKKMFLRGIFEELKFFLLGQTNTKILESKGVNIWKGNTSRHFLDSMGLTNYEEGDMGPLYGFQWRHFGATYTNCNADYSGQGVDQITRIIDELATNRFSRRAIITTYHTDQITQSPLLPCHGVSVQFGVEGENRLCCQMYQRSCDAVLGCPFNIASYALLTHILCDLINQKYEQLHPLQDPTLEDPTLEERTYTPLVPGKLTLTFGDCHVYETHYDAAIMQTKRVPHCFPKLTINKKLFTLEDISSLQFTDIQLSDYAFHPAIPVAMIA